MRDGRATDARVLPGQQSSQAVADKQQQRQDQERRGSYRKYGSAHLTIVHAVPFLAPSGAARAVHGHAQTRCPYNHEDGHEIRRDALYVERGQLVGGLRYLDGLWDEHARPGTLAAEGTPRGSCLRGA